MVKVGIIDTAINETYNHIVNITIKTLVPERTAQKELNSLHADEIVRILLSMTTNITIFGVAVLNDDIQGKAIDLIEAIEWCIEREVDFINLSLGYSSNDQKTISALHQICKKAEAYGTIIVAAETNNYGEKAYPANFPEVISVNSNYNQKEYCRIIGNKVTFNFNVLYSNALEIKKGNSYLVPFVLGLFVRLYISGEKKTDLLLKLKKLFSVENLEKMVVCSVKERFSNIVGKKILYVTYGTPHVQDLDIILYLEKIAKSIKKINVENESVKKNLSNIDGIVWGIGNCAKTINNQKGIQELIKYCFEETQFVVTILPYFNLWERYQITKNNTKQLISIYN